MPGIPVLVQVVGVQPDPTPSLTFTCTAKITFNARQCSHGPNRNFANSVVVSAQGGAFDVAFPRVAGGRLTLAITTKFQGSDLHKEVNDLVILGSNPPPGDVKAIMPHLTLSKIAKTESGFRQFVSVSGVGLMCPNWSDDNQGGVGIMQITRPQPSDEEVWSWRANAKRGQQIFSEKISGARRYAMMLRRNPEFRDHVELYNQRRAASGLPSLDIRVPDFTTGDFEANLKQMELDSIRGYNGWAGQDQFRLPLHEYRLALDDDGYLVVDVDEAARTGTVRWERVAPSDRPANSGNPDYVRMVLSQQP